MAVCVLDLFFLCHGCVILPLHVTVAKDLGVHIDCHLIFNEHITETASDCMFKQTRVNRIKHLLKKTLIYLINAFVFSKLFYCWTVWSSTIKKNVKKLICMV